MILELLIAAVPWSLADEAELAPVREAFGFSEGLRALEVGAWVSAEECGACHAQAYQEWRSSRHAVSGTNAIFLAGFREEPTIRCVRCHVPIREQARPFVRWLRERRHRDVELDPGGEGIGCAACHLRDGIVLTSRPIETKEHPTRYEPLLGDARFCAGCHQFRFERSHGAGASLTDDVTQDTWREWRASGAEQCIACHMDRYGHRMPGAHDLDLLKGAIEATVHPGAIELRAKAGHRVPTGDLFRHLSVEIEDGGWIEVARIGRRFEVSEIGGSHLKRMVEDSTLTEEPRRIPISGKRWRLVYRYTREDAGVILKEGPTIAPTRARSPSALLRPPAPDRRTSAR